MDELIREADDGLVKALVDEESPFFMPGSAMASSNSISSFIHSSLASTIYPGPTVEDIETALSYANYGIQDFPHEAKSEENRISLRVERGFTNKDDHENSYRYTLRIKSCGNVVADDGYKWRKYGQKSIKNSPNPRSYYRCTNARCSAKRQVERSTDDPDTLIITYEGLHFHFDYPFFMLDQQLDMDPPMKKHRGSISETQYQAHYSSPLSEERIQQEGPEKVHSSPIMESTEMGRQGLLEDMVPLMIRKPLMTNIIAAATSSSSASSSASRESHPSSPASSDSFSWSPDYLFPGFI